MDFLVSPPSGTMFLKLVDAFDRVKDAKILFEILNEMTRTAREVNVVQVIIDNASNYLLARKMLESKYRTIVWTPCATHCVDLTFEDIGKVEQVKNTVEHVKCITNHIYNLLWVLNTMKKSTSTISHGY